MPRTWRVEGGASKKGKGPKRGKGRCSHKHPPARFCPTMEGQDGAQPNTLQKAPIKRPPPKPRLRDWLRPQGLGSPGPSMPWACVPDLTVKTLRHHLDPLTAPAALAPAQVMNMQTAAQKSWELPRAPTFSCLVLLQPPNTSPHGQGQLHLAR